MRLYWASRPSARNSGSGDVGAGGGPGSTPLQISLIRSASTPICVSAENVDADTVTNRLFLCTHGIITDSVNRPAVETGGGNRSGQSSVWTWLTKQITGRLVQSGARYGMPLQTSTTRSQSRRWRVKAIGARTNWE